MSESRPTISYRPFDIKYGATPGKRLPPGKHTLVIRAPKLKTFVASVLVEAGKVLPVTYHVTRFPEGRTVRGWVHTGKLAPSRRKGDPLWSFSTQVSAGDTQWWAEREVVGSCVASLEYPEPHYWSELHGLNVASCEFYGVPAGPFSLRSYAIGPRRNGPRGLQNLLIQTKGTDTGDMAINTYLLDNFPGPGWGFRRLDLPRDRKLRLTPRFRSEPKWRVHTKQPVPDKAVFLEALGLSVEVPSTASPMPTAWAVTCKAMQPVYGTDAGFGPLSTASAWLTSHPLPAGEPASKSPTPRVSLPSTPSYS